MKKTKLSIIVPCYKVEQFLPRCLDSLVNQTLEDIEIICVNDGSPDNCLKIIKDYKKKYSDKIVIIDKENGGLWQARKDGIKIATGEYIGFVDSDDYVALEFAEKLYNKAAENDADISVCGYDRVDLDSGKMFSREMCKSEDKVINVKENPGAMLELNGAPWNKIYRAELLKNVHELKNVPKIQEDMMLLQLIYLNANKIVFVNDSLLYYMIRKGSIINSYKKENIKPIYKSMLEIKDIYEKSGTDLMDYLSAIAFLHTGVALMYRMSCDETIKFGQVLKENRKFLNENFPRWKKTDYTKLSYVLKNHGTNFKLWVVKVFINLGLFRFFLWSYKTMIKVTGKDIKW